MKLIYKKNFEKLIKLAPEISGLKVGSLLYSHVKNYMNLSLEVLSETERHIDITLAHYFEVNGDLIPDPDMTIRIFKKFPMIEALSYQDSFGYKRVYLDDDRFYPKLKKDLNQFLGTWLKNCLMQGHKLASCGFAPFD